MVQIMILLAFLLIAILFVMVISLSKNVDRMHTRNKMLLQAMDLMSERHADHTRYLQTITQSLSGIASIVYGVDLPEQKPEKKRDHLKIVSSYSDEK